MLSSPFASGCSSATALLPASLPYAGIAATMASSFWSGRTYGKLAGKSAVAELQPLANGDESMRVRAAAKEQLSKLR